MSTPEIIFLCGGRGARMGNRSEYIQKCMAPYFGKPLLERNLEAARTSFGAFRPILCVSYRASDVREYFGESWRGLPITYAFHECGTADRGALYSVRDKLQGSSCISVHGNILFDPRLLGALWQQHIASDTYATIALATKTNESHHVLMKPRIDGYIDDVLIPPPSSERWATIANNLDLNIFAPPVDKAIASEYRRDMGVHAYKTRAIFELLDQCDPRAVDMSWTLAWQVSHANLPQSVEYAQDWLHVEIQQDLARPCLSICNTASSSLVQEEYEIRK